MVDFDPGVRGRIVSALGTWGWVLHTLGAEVARWTVSVLVIDSEGPAVETLGTREAAALMI